MTTENKATGPVPVPQQESDFYWEKCKAHQLWLRKCNETGKAYFYPRDISPFTFSRDTSWIQASGKATLFTYGICYTPIPRYSGPVPFIIALVELEEGPLMPTNIVGVEPDPSETFEQYTITTEKMGDSANFLLDGAKCELLFYNDQLIGVDPPVHVVVEVTYTEPAARGNTTANVTKAATVETGAEVQVPAFIDQGEKIKVDARTGAYIERAK